MNYHITNFAIRHVNADATHLPKFEICIIFKRNIDAIKGILINYHLMCATLVIVASINFVIDPIVVPGRAGLLVTVYLVLSTFFSDAQVRSKYFHLCLLFLRFLIGKLIFDPFIQNWDREKLLELVLML